MDNDINDNDIFGTFRILTPTQIKRNAIYAAGWAVFFSITLVGVAIAVWTKIVWIAPAIFIIGLCVFCLIPGIHNIEYARKFSKKYNILRTVICGFLVYSGVGWRGLLGLYNYLILGKGLDMTITSYGWMILLISLIITLITKMSLYRIVNVQVADLVGIIEITALGIFIGSIMFLLLYT